MNPLELCAVETVEIAIFGDRGATKTLRVTAHRYLDFAAHKQFGANLFNQKWAIVHLPSGLRAAKDFQSIELAAAAMVEIARLRNDWSCIEEDDAGRETAAKVREIIRRIDPRADVGNGRNGTPLRLAMNGYAAERASA